MLTLNDSRLETEGSPATVTEGGDVLAALSDRSQTLQRASNLPAKDRGDVAQDLRVSAGYRLLASDR